jgi:S-adenosylmethionine:tRNA ribosyltransferase-isomerase
MRVDLFDFDLPSDRIALYPARPRDSARLLHVSASGAFDDCVVRELPDLLRAGDLLVFNDTRVIHAALGGVRTARGDGGDIAVSINLHRRVDGRTWLAFARPGKRLRVGDTVRFGDTLSATVAGKTQLGEVRFEFDRAGDALDAAIAACGAPPLPPYILAQRSPEAEDEADYQTVYAHKDGAVAAPTAGLHFTESLFDALGARGVERAMVTLHVSAGTFLPVKTDDTSDHVMHTEWREVSPSTAAAVNRARAEGRRVIAIGTTALRSLESSAGPDGAVVAGSGDTDIFITPGYRFRVVDGLWTNFHLPRSTLFMLVSAFAGLERMRAVYAHAIATGYRFYSFGDASLLWRAEAG